MLEFEPDGKAADEIQALFKLICKQVNMTILKKTVKKVKRGETRRTA